MSLEIFPKDITYFPNDEQLFTTRADRSDALWCGIINGVVQPDYSVRRTQTAASGAVMSAQGALELRSGVGEVEFTLTPACIPTSTSELFLDFRHINPANGTWANAWQFTVTIESDGDVTVETTAPAGTPNTVATFNVPLSSGMRFLVQLGANFRLYVNAQLRASVTTFNTAVAYPAAYRVELGESVLSGPPAIPAPSLEGDWHLRSRDTADAAVVAFTAPSEGDLDAAPSLRQILYNEGQIPGMYTLLARVNPGVDSWMEDAVPAGATQLTQGGDAWTFVGSNPTPNTGTLCHKSSNIAGDHAHYFETATATLQINKDDILYCDVFVDATNPPTEIMLEFCATDATNFSHRAYWGANSLNHGVNGTPSRWRIGDLPATGQWIRLLIPASLVDLEGRTLNGASFRLFNGVCSFDQLGKFPGKLQSAEALITIPPLKILSELVQTIQPGTKIRPQTNYDLASVLATRPTWAVASGSGSFSGNEFTAPSGPSTSILRASGPGNQSADMAVTVPAIITPAHTVAAPLEVIDFDTNIPATVTWSSTPSGINSSTGAITFPNTPGASVRIQATNGSFTAFRDILIIPKFPFSDFSLPVSWDRNLDALISMSEDRTSRITREKARPYDSYPIKLTSRTLADSNTVDAFFDQQGYGKPFILEDVGRGIRKVGWFDSKISHEARDPACDIDLAFQFLEAPL